MKSMFEEAEKKFSDGKYGDVVVMSKRQIESAIKVRKNF